MERTKGNGAGERRGESPAAQYWRMGCGHMGADVPLVEKESAVSERNSAGVETRVRPRVRRHFHALGDSYQRSESQIGQVERVRTGSF